MFLIFSLRRPNVLPIGDYGVQMAIESITKSANCRNRKIWKRLRAPGSHTEAWLAGTCGEVWTSKRFDT